MRIVDINLRNGMAARITRPERDDFPDNLGGAVQYALANVLTWVAETSGEALGAFGGSALVSFLEHIEPGLVEYYSPIIEQLRGIEGMPDWFDTFLDKIQHPTDEVGAAVGQAVLGSAAGGITSSLLGVLLSPLTYGLNDKIRPARPVLPDLLAMGWRDVLDDVTIDDWLADQGWPEPAIEAYRSVLRPRLTVADLIAWAWRVHQDPEAIRDELEKRGYSTDSVDQYMELAKRIPGPSDLVTFALREVWREDLRPELLEPDAPEKYYELMAKQGLNREFAEDYWASHWRLPSAAQGFEMFWRLDDFTEEDLKQLLVRLDILRAYQDNLIKIAYRPITRVDVRRMHATGQISDAELPRHYRDIGFSPEYAQKMADFTIAYNAGTETEYTKSEILKGYNLGMLEPDEAVSLLTAIGKSEDYAWYVLALEDYKREMDIIEQETDIVGDLYTRWEIDATTARGRLSGLGLKGEHIDRLMEEWGIARRAKLSLPTRSNIEEFYKADTITAAQAREELWKRRYPDYAVDWYLKLWDTEIAEAARKELERAEKEQQREAKSSFRNKRSIALANLNRQIAELRLLIAELKLAAYHAETDEQTAAIKENIMSAKAQIAELQLQKAELPVVIEEER